MKPNILVVAGPTAVGKTQYSLDLAMALDGEIVSCDSMQLYKYMDIGSAKPTKDELAMVPHHLIDVVDPRESFSVVEYKKLAKSAITDIINRGKLPIIAGGTGLYLNSLLYDLDFGPLSTDNNYRQSLMEFLEVEGKEQLHNRLMAKDKEAASRIHPNNVKRVIRALEIAELGQDTIGDFSKEQRPTQDYKPVLVGINRDRALLYDRINKRVDILMEQGLEDEVKGLMAMGFTADHISMKGIGYKELILHYQGEYDLETAVDLIKKNTRHYAKRQITWFKRYKEVRWFTPEDYDSTQNSVEDIIKWYKENR